MFRVFVGIGFKADGSAITADERVAAENLLLDRAADLFGGATLSQGVGAWKDAAGVLVKEPCFVFDLGTVDTAAVDQFAAFARDTLSQNSVAVQALSPSPLQFV
jgi:CHASE1-domain containing sensor protein